MVHYAENHGFEPIDKAKSGKKSTMDHEIATFDIRRVCVTIKKYSVNKPPPPHSDSTILCKGK